MTGFILVLLLHMPALDEPVRLTIAPSYATEAECLAAEPAIYDAVIPPADVELEAMCQPVAPLPVRKPAL